MAWIRWWEKLAGVRGEDGKYLITQPINNSQGETKNSDCRQRETGKKVIKSGW